MLTKEYGVRREVLLTRCDVTIQSFKWSDKAKVSGSKVGGGEELTLSSYIINLLPLLSPTSRTQLTSLPSCPR